MSQPLLSVVIPTIGRPTLAAAIRSVADQPAAGLVEVVVIADRNTYDGPIQRVAPGRLNSLCTMEYDAGFSAWGHPQRNCALRWARGEYVAFLDDDDAWTPDALGYILDAITFDPKPLHIFKMRYANSGMTLWFEKAPDLGNVGTPMMVVRNDPAFYGEWGQRYEGDFDFLTSTIGKVSPNGVRWHPEVIADIRPADA